MQRLSHPELLKLAHESFVREDWISAARYYKEALGHDRENPAYLRKAALSLAQSNALPEAEDFARRACKRHPSDPDNWVALALVYQKLERGDDLQAALDRALRVDPQHGPAIHAKAKAYHEAGQPERAIAVTTEALSQSSPHPLAYMIHARVCRTLDRLDDGIEAARTVALDASLGHRYRLGANFELGALLDAKGEYDEAFEAFTRANAGMPPGPPLHADSTITTWTKEFYDSVPESGESSERPVLIVGVARSGTTLTEQIISAHPHAAGVGELVTLPQIARRTIAANLTRETLADYAREYLDVLEGRVGPGPLRVVDKHMYAEPTLGLVTRMFPNIRIIHSLRDPLDCCLSAFFQNFGANMPVSRDLPTLGRHYVAHRRIMDHWRDVLGVPILTSVYEDLVAEQEPRSRELIGFLGLEWDDACLRFHENTGTVRTASTAQVRKPMYKSSTQRWRRYEKHLGPLIAALGPYAEHAREVER